MGVAAAGVEVPRRALPEALMVLVGEAVAMIETVEARGVLVPL